MHEARVLHRDFTLRNILVDSTWTGAKLFDFDLALSLDDVAGVSYKTHYQGRIFGSPGFSVPPEILDPGLMECAITQRMDEGTTTRYSVRTRTGQEFNCFVGGTFSMLGRTVSEAVCSKKGEPAKSPFQR